MKKFINTFFAVVTMCFVTARGQTVDFEGNSIGDSLATIGWSTSDIQAKIADDPVASGNKVLRNAINNYNAAPVLKYVLPAGKTLGGYSAFSFKGYFAQGDVGFKDITVEAYQTKPTAQFGNNAGAKIGSFNRAQMGSTAWENITINIPTSSSLHDTIYLAFGISCAGTGNVGGTGVATVWYADNIKLVEDTTIITKWGFFGHRGAKSSWGGHRDVIGNWTFVPGGVTGDAGIQVGKDTSSTIEWAVIRGGFANPVTATTANALNITGKIEFTGNGFDSWSGLRYGLWYNDSAGSIITKVDTISVSPLVIRDSTRWDGREDNTRGYFFAPISGTARATDGAWGIGTHGVDAGGNWLSVNGGGDRSYGTSRQKPARAVSTAGVYEFAMSVQPLANGTKEVRFYMIKGTAANSATSTYYFGGSFIDTSALAPTFNGIIFGAHVTGSGANPTFRGMKLTDVKVALGAPVVVPEAPWQDYYVDQWGFFGHRGAKSSWGGHRDVIGNWTFVPGDVIGNAGIQVGKDTSSTIEWAVIRGGFIDPVAATTAKALNITGKIEFTGNGFDSWSGLRYGLWYNDSAGSIITKVDTISVSPLVIRDSTRWDGREDNTRGYFFAPISGTARATDGAWGIGTHGVDAGGNWLSVNGGGDRSYGTSRQKPARAVSTAGVYEFAMSVQPLANGTKEVRFYMIKGTAANSATSTYYFGGSFIDTSALAPTFNGIIFGAHVTGSGANPTFRGMKLTDVKVALGAPVVVPEAPWQDYYVDQWGFFGHRGAKSSWGGHRDVIGNWTFVPGDVIGNAGIQVGKDTSSTIEWAVIRGGFIDPVAATTAKALNITGKIEFTGNGFDSWSGLRYGLWYNDSAGSIITKVDTISVSPLVIRDSTRWDGREDNTRGYFFAPISGTARATDGAWGIGTHGVDAGGNWLSVNGGGDRSYGTSRQKPARAVSTAGVYEFAMSVQPKANGTKDVSFYMIKGTTAQSATSTYYFGGTFTDTSALAPTFNGIIFGAHVTGSGANPTFRGMKLTDVKVALGAPIVPPVAPWQDYYVDQWGFLGGKLGGWHFVPAGVIGNAGVEGSAANTSLVALRGEFVEPHDFPVGKALEVEGKVTLTGGGFANNTLSFGLFQSDSAGSLIVDTAAASLPDSTRWNGKETGNFGYLYMPSSSAIPWNSGTGTWGGVVNGIPYSPTNAGNYVIGSEVAGAAGTAGTYDFLIHVGRQTNGSNYVKYSFKKSGYTFEGQKKYDANASAAHKFNSIVFALKEGNTTTALNVADVKVKQVTEVTAVASETGLPTVYALSQNYPNPFNPSTTIQYDVPKNAHVLIGVYDILGRLVTTLVNGNQEPSRYTVQWNASNFGSGVYFYRIDARNEDGSGSFTSVKKLLLVK